MCDGSLYGEALRELQQQFGDPTAVVRSSIDQVLRLPPVTEHSPTQLAELSRALHAAVSGLISFEHHADLAATTNIAAVVAKLPLTLAWKWGEEAVARRPTQLTLGELDTWLLRQALAARAVHMPADDDGCWSRENVTACVMSDRKDGHRHGAASGAAVPGLASISALTTVPVIACAYCGGGHGLDCCGKFARLSATDRMQIASRVREASLRAKKKMSQ